MNENSDADLEIELAQIEARLQLRVENKQFLNENLKTQAVKVQKLLGDLTSGPFGPTSFPPLGETPKPDGDNDGPRNNPNFF